MLQEKYSQHKILVFDVDDTLVITQAKIQVCDLKGRPCYELTPAEFNEYKHSKGQLLKFDQFKSLAIMKAGQLIDKYIKILETNYKKGNAIGIITARDSQQLIYQWLKEEVGFHIDKRLIFAINDPEQGFKGSIAHRKKQAMERIIELGYTDISFFDDDRNNIQIVQQLAQQLQLPIKTHLAQK